MCSKVVIDDLIDMNYVKDQLLDEYQIYTDENIKEIDLNYLVYAYHTIMTAILREVWLNRDNPKYVSNKTTSAAWNNNCLSKGELTKNRHVKMKFDYNFKYIEKIRETIEDVLRIKQEVLVTGVNPIDKLLNLKYNPFERGALSNENIMKEIINDDNITVSSVNIYSSESLFSEDAIHVKFSVTERDVNLRGLFFKSLLGL